MSKNIDDYLTEGMHGTIQSNPDERRQFLGTLRERTVFALTVEEVTKGLGVKVLDQKMTEHPDAKLLLNGEIPFQKLNPYRQLAMKHDSSYTIVDEKGNEKTYGLVLTYDHYVNIENILLEDNQPKEPKEEKQEKPKEKKSFWKRLFGMD